MFYSQFILAKKGPLGTIWIAAHLERKLRKTQVTETNISVSVDSILFPDVPIALRLSGHLLLGVVRIYSRKVNYLFHDCSEALVKIKQAFHAGAVDLPPEASTAPFHSITLPETFDIDDLELLPDHDSALFLANSSIDHHVTAREQITLQDPIDDNAYMNAQFGIDERFPDEGEQRLTLEFEENEGCEKLQNEERSPVLEDDVLPSIEVDEEIEKDGNTAMELDTEPIKLSVDNQSEFPAILTVSDTVVSDDTNARCQIPVAGSDDMEENVLQPCAQESVQEARSEEAVGPAVVIAEVDALDEGPQVENMETEGTELDGIKDADELVDDTGETAFTEPTEMTAERLDGDVQISESPQQLLNEVPDVEKLRSADATVNFAAIDDKLQCEHPVLEEATSEASLKSDTVHESRQFDETPVLKLDSSISLRKSTPPSVLTVPDFEDVPDDDDVLASILGRRTRALRVAPTPTNLPPAKRQKRGPKPVSKKRKIVFDKQTVLHGDAMREQLADTSDIRRVRLKAPCTEYEIWGSERQAQCQNIFYEPSIPGLSEELRELYHCIYEEQLPLASAADLERQNSLAAPVATESVDGTDNVQQLCLAGPTEERDENHPAAKSITLADGEISNCEPESIIDDAPDIQQEPLDLAVDDTKTEENISAGEEHSLQVSVENSKGDEAVAINQSEDGQEDIATVPEESQALSENAIEQENEAQEEKLEDETAAVRVDDDNHQDIINAEECEQSSPIEKHDAPSEAAYTEVNNGEIKGDCEVDTEGCMEQKVVVSDMVAVEEEALASVGTPAQDTEASVGHVTDEEHPQEALEFLTDAKDADDEASDDSVEDDHAEDATKVQDNSGWSSRTRAVAQYLRMTFDTMENNKTTPNLNLDRLLHGKCRREAARMFFETLVLKTKDYIHTEQSHSYADIRIEPRTKLMKADH